PPDSDIVNDVSERSISADGDGKPIRSLQQKCAGSTALACTLIAASAFIASRFNPSLYDLSWPVQLAVVAFCGALFGVWWGWLMPRSESRFLAALRTELRKWDLGGESPSNLPETRSKELARIRRAILDLRAGWRRREDDDRVQRQRLEELTEVKSNIISIVSHDMRTPLTSILLYAQMLSEEINSLAEEDQKTFLTIISDECNRLSRLVDDLVEVQRLESGRTRWNLEEQDLSAAVRASARVFEAMAISKSIELTVGCPDSLPCAVADVDKISQVLSNLLSNALKYTPSGGHVLLVAETRGSEIVLCVRDDGPGIPREKWDQIFDRFAQLADPNTSESSVGVGLGLYIVKRIIEAHGGAAWLNSEVGHGSEFFVSLPMRGPTVRPADDSHPTRTAGRVVVCDADPELAATMAQTLRGEEYDVRVAHSGGRLLTQLDQGDADVVVTDLCMTDINANQLLQALSGRANRSFRTIIHSYEGDGRELTRRGVDVFLRRPVSRNELIQAVHLAMQKRSAAGLTVLVIENALIDTLRLSQLLSSAGHTSVMAENIKEAVSLVNDCAIDVILVASDSLSSQWSELDGFGIIPEDNTRVMVLGDAIRRNKRLLERLHNATAIPYHAGDEEAVVDAIMIPGQAVPSEYSQ
ncbi:MAG: hybrid sensor histidine kinase/response regulator, partial [Phycisphaerales bacterium]